jgi:hypothetical protein
MSVSDSDQLPEGINHDFPIIPIGRVHVLRSPHSPGPFTKVGFEALLYAPFPHLGSATVTESGALRKHSPISFLLNTGWFAAK